MLHKITIAAMEYSETALKMLKESDCKIVKLKEIMNAERIRVIV